MKPSTIILSYLVFSLAFDAVQCRTLWLLQLHPLSSVFSASLACKATLLVLEVSEKRHILLAPWRHLGPEMTSSIISRSFFWWLNALLIRGFRAPLSSDALYDIDDALKSEMLLGNLLREYAKWKDSKLFRKYRLLLAMCASLKTVLLMTALPRLVLIGFKFAQPFLINRVTTYTQQQQTQKQDENNDAIGYALVGATALIFFGTGVCRGLHQHKLYRSLTSIRGVLIALVYDRTLDVNTISSTSSKDAAVALTGPDIIQIVRAFTSFHEIWANSIEIVIAIWLLERELGPGCIGPVVVVIGT